MARRGCLGPRLLVLLTVALATPAAAQVPSVSLDLVTAANSPTHIWHAGDNRLFVLERDGLIRIFVPGQGFLPTPFLDLTEKVGRGGERGLYAIAFHPQYATNGYFFVSHADAGTGRNLVARYQVSANPNLADPNSEEEVLALGGGSGVHNGGQIAFGPDGYLWYSFGDGGGQNDANCLSQNDQLFFGKILRVDVDTLPYTVPPDNPFVGTADPGNLVRDEIWAKGLRNPWRFTFDRLLGDLFIGDVGQDIIEEVDWEPAGSAGGRNYGWKVMEGSNCHDEDPVDADCQAGTPSCFSPAYTPAMHEYVHGGLQGNCAVVSGFVYRGTAIAGLQGKYTFADLCSGLIWSLEQTSPGVWGNQRILAKANFTRSFGEDAQGELYVATTTEVYKLVPGSGHKQSRLQQACVNTMNRKGSEVTKARIRNDAKCVRAAGQRRLATLGSPPTLEGCLAFDVGGRSQRAAGTLAKREALQCLARPEQMPSFGYRASATVAAAATTSANRVTHSLFGADADAPIVFQDQNVAGADCQADVADRGAALLENLWRTALSGKRLALAGTPGGQAAVTTPEDLGARVLAHVDADARDMIGRQVTKLGTTLAGSCAGQPLDLRFPGDCRTQTATATDFRDCIAERVRCHFCRSFEAFDGLTADCDGFDDGAANASCSSEADIVCGADGTGVNWAAADFDCPRLSHYRLFADPMDPRQNGVGGLPYDLTTPLFSDYALKYRILFLPPGTSATYDANLPFTFPVSTIIAKTFSFADDLRNPSLGEEVIETRLLIHRASGWEGLPYIWLPGMSDAVLSPDGGTAAVSWIDLAGNPRSTDYAIPSMPQCGFCHFGPGDDPIGPKARLLNKPYPYPGGSQNQLDHWTAVGALSGAPPSGSAPRLPVWDDAGDGTLEQRAKAYIESNCHHCHNPDGRASFVDLNFLHSQALDQTYGICKPANDGVAGLTYVIAPGAPASSILAYRLGSVLDDERMPEIERSVRHDEGVALVESWIGSLSGSCP